MFGRCIFSSLGSVRIRYLLSSSKKKIMIELGIATIPKCIKTQSLLPNTTLIGEMNANANTIISSVVIPKNIFAFDRPWVKTDSLRVLVVRLLKSCETTFE